MEISHVVLRGYCTAIKRPDFLNGIRATIRAQTAPSGSVT
jgi:hypothetical protein